MEIFLLAPAPSWLLTNQLYWPTTKSITPTLRFGFAIDCGVGFFENFFPFLRSIPKKCYSGQAGAVFECVIPDAGDAIWNRDTPQANAAMESITLYDGDTIWNRDARQAVASHEGTPCDAGDAIWNRNARQAAARPEGIPHDEVDAIRDRDACQTGAV